MRAGLPEADFAGDVAAADCALAGALTAGAQTIKAVTSLPKRTGGVSRTGLPPLGWSLGLECVVGESALIAVNRRDTPLRSETTVVDTRD